MHEEEEDELEQIPSELPLVDPAEDPLMRATRKAQDLFATAAAAGPQAGRERGLVRTHAAAPKRPVGTPSSSFRAARARRGAPARQRAPRPAIRRREGEGEGARTQGRDEGQAADRRRIAAILLDGDGLGMDPPAHPGRPALGLPHRQEGSRAFAVSDVADSAAADVAARKSQAAVDQLPHLTPETIEVVIKKSAYRPRDPAEVFSRAETAAVRGMSSLPEEEAKELAALRLAVARSLRPMDRQRVRGYERIRTGRELLSVSEDVRVLALFARGVRALPPEKRERLQTLLGKAIVAELGPLPSPDGTYSAATPGR